METQSCGSCRFWMRSDELTDINGTGDDDPREYEPCGSCRRYPPVLISIMDDRLTPMAVYRDRWEYPVMLSNDWCGEFQRRDGAL